MNKRLLALFLFFTAMIAESYGQTAPVLIKSTDSVGSNFVLLTIQYVPHDTGVIRAQVLMQQGTGTSVYDSTYTLFSHTVLGTDTATLYIGPLSLCGPYTLLFDMSNDSLQGIQYNPLDSLTIVCTDVEQVEIDNFKLMTEGHLVEIESKQLPPNGVAEIYDMTGRRIASGGLHQSTESMTLNTANGIYLLRIMSNGQMVYSSKLSMF